MSEAQHTGKAQPVRFHYHDSDLAVNVVRTVAYRAVCACGWKSKTAYSSFDDARRAAREHRLETLGLD